MVQILPNREHSYLDALFGGAASGAEAFSQLMPQLQKQQQEQKKQEFLERLLSVGQQQGGQKPGMGDNNGQSQQQRQGSQKGGFDPTQITDEAIVAASAIDPNIGRTLQHLKDVNLRENRENKKAEQKKFETERSFHSGFSKEAEKEIEVLRSSLPKKEMALNFARNSVETGDMSYFSKDKLADATGIDLFRTAKGAQLVTAGKENLLSNMSRVSARGQNIWFEQRLNSMFPKIGQSPEANLTVQEMLEGESSLDKAYLNEFDRLSEEDEKNFGYVKKDISKRAHQAMKPLENHILQRTTYRMKEIEEQEKGLSKLKSEVGKNVEKGTPLTMAMAKLYADKFGDKALKVAEKNGYYIPSIEDFSSFQERPDQFREGL
jgi:hypothetical protein